MIDLPRRLPAALTVLSLLLLAGCDQDEAATSAPEIRPVRTQVLTYRAAQPLSRLVGDIRPHYEAELGFKIGGRVASRPAALGLLVRKGQELARLDGRDEHNQDLAARADLAAALASQTQAKAEEKRQITLHERGWATQARLESAREARQSADAAVDAARARAKLAHDRLDDAILRASADGTITQTLVEPGQVVAAGQTVLRLARLDRKDAVFSLAERLAAGLSVGDGVQVAALDAPEALQLGQIGEIAPTADTITRTVLVKVTLATATTLRLGQPVSGHFPSRGRPLAALPSAALSQLDGQPALWVVEATSGAVTPVKVVVDHLADGQVLIAEGPPEGARVVTAGVQLLRPGQVVRIAAGTDGARP